MSTWIEIEDSGDVDLSEDGKEMHVLYSNDDCGNNYVSIPIEFVKKAISHHEMSFLDEALNSGDGSYKP